MIDSPQRALAEAEEWLQSSKLMSERLDKHELAAAVCCAQAIHALIRANDALTLSYFGKKSARHDDAPFLFMELIEQNKIEEKENQFEKILIKAMTEKSGADYGKSIYSKKDAYYFIQEAEKFITMVKSYVKTQK
ncbi:MAG: HEPN domain-containing protein [Candidatus Micrarchaeota archaeon]|nr:HEPN domain-containing protein [Candidatus Micrarchaeota archaeon]